MERVARKKSYSTTLVDAANWLQREEGELLRIKTLNLGSLKNRTKGVGKLVGLLVGGTGFEPVTPGL